MVKMNRNFNVSEIIYHIKCSVESPRYTGEIIMIAMGATYLEALHKFIEYLKLKQRNFWVHALKECSIDDFDRSSSVTTTDPFNYRNSIIKIDNKDKTIKCEIYQMNLLTNPMVICGDFDIKNDDHH